MDGTDGYGFRFSVKSRLLYLEATGFTENRAHYRLMYAVALGSLDEVKGLLERGADLEATDYWSRTPWLLSLHTGDMEKAKLLLAAGANRHACGRYQKTSLMYAIENADVEMLTWLLSLGFDPNGVDESDTTPLMLASEAGDAACVQVLLAAGADASRERKYGAKAISEANDIEVVRLLVAAGEELSAINDTMRLQLTGIGENELSVTPAQYRSGKHRRFGKANPERMDIPFWRAMIRINVTAYEARIRFEKDYPGEPVWCYRRFGRSITLLPDGRVVEVGGEHEDDYDPDFCIYNDVVVYDGTGGFEIYGYPESVFPPTDFHTATLVGDCLYLIGSLGYYGKRKTGETPVYRLHLDTFRITTVKTTGEKPGWISRHKARYVEPGRIQVTGGKIMKSQKVVENSATYTLTLANLRWSQDRP